MTEIWQSYGSWILYGLFFVVMIVLHGRMHGGHGHHGGHDHQATPDPTTRPAPGGSSEHTHGAAGAASGRSRRGCC